MQNTAVIPRKKRHITLSEMTNGMRKNGIDPAVIEKRAKRLMEKKQATWEAAEARDRDSEMAGGDDDFEMGGEDDGEVSTGRKGKKGRAVAHAPGTNRQLAGMATRGQSDKAVELRMFAQRGPARLAKAGESDRHVPITRPKWMLSGKRKGGKTDRR